jgi:hypothetical protein
MFGLFYIYVLTSSALVEAASGDGIVMNPGKYGSYYHLLFELNASVVDFQSSDRRPRTGGQFEIRIRPDKFPVSAPNCRGQLILRMPWTGPAVDNAKKKIAAKEALLKGILALQEDRDKSVSVVIELNPYVKIVSQDPLILELTQCNIYFRDAGGAYIEDTRPWVSE